MDPNTGGEEWVGEEIIKDTDLTLDQNIKHRPDYMEDYAKVHQNFMGDKNRVLLTLFDGHSGIEVAKQSIENFPIMFEKSLKDNKDNVEKSFLEAFKTLDDTFTQYDDLGATDCIVYICIEDKKRVLYSANCGDSRSVLVRNGETIRLSYDHKATDDSEKKRVRKAKGMFMNGRLAGTLAITRSLGDYILKKDGGFGLISEPFIKRVVLTKDDQFVIMASDGIWDVINEVEAHNLVSGKKDLNAKQLSELFIAKSLELGTKDNLSCIATRLN